MKRSSEKARGFDEISINSPFTFLMFLMKSTGNPFIFHTTGPKNKPGFVR